MTPSASPQLSDPILDVVLDSWRITQHQPQRQFEPRRMVLRKYDFPRRIGLPSVCRMGDNSPAHQQVRDEGQSCEVWYLSQPRRIVIGFGPENRRRLGHLGFLSKTGSRVSTWMDRVTQPPARSRAFPELRHEFFSKPVRALQGDEQIPVNLGDPVFEARPVVYSGVPMQPSAAGRCDCRRTCAHLPRLRARLPHTSSTLPVSSVNRIGLAKILAQSTQDRSRLRSA